MSTGISTGHCGHGHENQRWAVNMAGEIPMDNVDMDTENDAMHCGYLWKWGNNTSHCGHWHGKQWWALWIWKWETTLSTVDMDTQNNARHCGYENGKQR